MAPDDLIPPQPPVPPLPPPAAPPRAEVAGRDEYEKKLNDLEKRLQEEREKLLLAQLRSQEEQASSAKIEVGLKELQDKMRRDRRAQEAEEARLKLEKKAAELETRLAQERETWVVTLKNQLAARESQEKEVETHFAARFQEMERRWQEEKVGWQRAALAKDEEIRALRARGEVGRAGRGVGAGPL